MQPILNIILATPFGGGYGVTTNPSADYFFILLCLLVVLFTPATMFHAERYGAWLYAQLAVVVGIPCLVWIISTRCNVRPRIRLALTCLAYVGSCFATNVILFAVDISHL